MRRDASFGAYTRQRHKSTHGASFKARSHPRPQWLLEVSRTYDLASSCEQCHARTHVRTHTCRHCHHLGTKPSLNILLSALYAEQLAGKVGEKTVRAGGVKRGGRIKCVQEVYARSHFHPVAFIPLTYACACARACIVCVREFDCLATKVNNCAHVHP